MGVIPIKRKKSRKKRRITLLLILCVVLVLSLRFVPGYLLGGEQLRHELESQLTEVLGTPVQMESVNITLFPVLRVRFYGLRAGDEELHFHADTCDVFIDWHQLVQRKIRITTVSIPRMQAVVAGEYAVAVEHLNRMVDTLHHNQQQPFLSSEKRVQVALESVEVEALEVMVDSQEIAVGSLYVEDLTSPEITMTLKAKTVDAAKAIDLAATLQLERHANQPPVLTGQAAVVFSRKMMLSKAGKPVQVSGELHTVLSGKGINDIAFLIEGDAAIVSGDAAVQGVFDAKAWWQQGAFIVNDLHWQSPGLEFLADATMPINGEESALHLYHAELHAPLTNLVLGSLRLPLLKLEASEDTVITITDLLSGMRINPVPRLVSGNIAATGIIVTDVDGQPVFPNLHVEAAIEEDRITLKKMAAGDWTITGTITPDVAAGKIAYGLQASGTMKKEHLHLLSPTLAHRLEAFSGNMQLEEIAGVYVVGSRNISLPRCKGHLSNTYISFLRNDDQVPMKMPDVAAGFVFDNNVLSLEGVQFGGSMIEGKIQPVPGKAPQAEITGSIQLADIPFADMVKGMPARNLKGYLDVASFSLAFHEDASTQLHFDGVLRDVSASVQTTLFMDQLNSFSGKLTIENHEISIAATGASEHLGVLRGEGVYNMNSHHAAGEVSLDLGAAAGNLLPEFNWRIPVAGIVADTYGQTGFTFTADFPATATSAGALELRSQNEPLLYFQGELFHDVSGWRLGERHFQSAIPLPVVLKHVNLQREVSGATPFPLEVEGLVQVRYEQSQAGMPFVLALDATSCTVHWSPWIYKAPDIDARALIQGSNLQVGTVELLLGEQAITLYHDGMGNYQARDVTVPLEKLKPFIVPDINLNGEALVSFNTSPAYVQAQLQNVQVTLLGEQALGGINGIVIYNDDETQLRGMSLRGNGFDCRLDATRNGEVWQASLGGARFDVNRFVDASEALAEIRGLDSPRITGMTMPNLTGTLEVKLNEVAYKRGVIQRVSSTMLLTPEIITTENLAFLVGQGKVAGRARIQPEHPGIRKPVSIYADLQVDAVDIAHGEKLIFKKERELSGLASGTIEFQIPTGKESFRRMDGKFRLRLWNGSLGKLGFASRLIGLLRNREIVLLRMPSLQDEGLTYDEARLQVSMRNGLAQLENCAAGSPSYTLAATGLVDFAHMQSDVQVTLDIFQGVTGLIEHLPVIGPTATSVVKEATRIRLRATGSPFDIQWQPDVIP